ncbi:MAG: imidazoleglycerol-phosphate dehydratase HisB [Gemmatimonadota bacterium]|nr:imidazoleglycerol-phosphate dehydratase HisB [Gemmatimonadota bacterium]
MTERIISIKRTTKETDVDVQLNLDGKRELSIETGIGMLDHLLTSLAFHASLDLTLKATGDLHVDDHHTVEDTAIVLGSAFEQAIGDAKGITRFGYAYAPLDEALARTVVDISGRPFAAVDLGLSREFLGALSSENVPHWLETFAFNAKITLHVDVLRGNNDHHRAEAAFKSLALALIQAIRVTTDSSPLSTKGSIGQGTTE